MRKAFTSPGPLDLNERTEEQKRTSSLVKIYAPPFRTGKIKP